MPIWVNGFKDPEGVVSTTSTDVTLTPSDKINLILVTTGIGGVIITLPADPSTLMPSVWEVVIKKVDAGVGNLTIARNANLIDGAAADFVTNTQNDSVIIKTDGSNYYIAGGVGV